MWINPSEVDNYRSFFGLGTTYSYVRMKNGTESTSIEGETDTNSDHWNITASGTIFEVGKWTYMVLVWNSDKTWTMYIDGVSKGTSSATTDDSMTIKYIGRGYSADNEFNGNITEAGYWDRTLTALEVASLYNQGMPTNLLVNRNDYQSGNPTVFNTKQVDFDGTDDYAAAGLGSPLVTGDNPITLSAWVKTDQASSNAEGSISVGVASSGQSHYLGRNSSSGNWGCGIYGNNIDSNVSVVVNTWVHLVYTYAGGSGGAIKMYVNGVEKASSTGTANIPTSATSGTYIGRIADGSHYFDGDISQAGIWNSTLTADEVSSLYNHGLPIDLTTDQAAYESSSNLVGYWRMGSGTLDTYPLIADQTNATLGSELVLNGDFATDSDWTKGTGWTISGGVATSDGTATNLTQGISIAASNTYEVTFTISSYTSGAVRITLNNSGDSQSNTSDISSAGTHTAYLTVGTITSGNIIIDPRSNFVGSIDNVSVKQVNGNPAIMTNQTSSDIENGSPYANVVQNGDFATDSDWTKGTGWAISGGTANCNGTQSSTSTFETTVGISGITNKQVKFTFDITNYQAGNLSSVTLQGTGANEFINLNSNGTYTAYISSTDNTPKILFNADADFVGSIDNVTVEEVNTGLQGYWKMGDGTNDEYPVIYDQTNPDLGSEVVINGDFAISGTPSTDTYSLGWYSNTANVSITNGTLILTNSALVSSSRAYVTDGVSSTNALTINKFYKLQYDVVANNGVSVLNYYVGGSGYDAPLTVGTHIIYFESGSNQIFQFRNRTTDSNIVFDNVSIKDVQGNPATMTNMVEGNITNQYPLTKIRNYYRMGDGILDGYPIIQDQTSPNLAHIPTTNLVTYSEDFSQWTTGSNTSLTYESGIIAPDGSLGVYRLTLPATFSTYIRSNTFANTNPLTLSVYAKSASSNNDFNLYSGTLPASPIKVATSDWQRFDFVTEGTDMYIVNDGDTFITDIYIWGAQAEEQSQATAYIKSDGIAAVRKSSTTNLIPYSEDFTQWDKEATVTLTPNYSTSPIGTNNATRVQLDADDSVYLSSLGSSKTFSIYVKGVAGETIRISNGVANNFTLTGNWDRLQVYDTSGSSTLIGINTYSSVTARDIQIWGGQLEEQTQAETYAPTTGLPVTIDLFTENNYGTMTNMSSSDIIEDTPNN